MNIIQVIVLPKRSRALAEDHLKKRGVKSRKEELIDMIQPFALQSKHLSELSEKIRYTALTPYYRRGMLVGIIDTNKKKYRLVRLGISLEKVQDLTLEELRLRELKELSKVNAKKLDRDTDFKRKSYE